LHVSAGARTLAWSDPNLSSVLPPRIMWWSRSVFVPQIHGMPNFFREVSFSALYLDSFRAISSAQ
jgi:hypothetical protein